MFVALRVVATILVASTLSDFNHPISDVPPYATAKIPSTITETNSTGQSFSVGAIRTALTDSQFDNELIRVGDFGCVFTYGATVTFAPTVTDQCSYDGKPCQIISADIDGADAAVKLILRAL
jgi:hypothetical protein